MGKVLDKSCAIHKVAWRRMPGFLKLPGHWSFYKDRLSNSYTSKAIVSKRQVTISIKALLSGASEVQLIDFDVLTKVDPDELFDVAVSTKYVSDFWRTMWNQAQNEWEKRNE